MACVVERLETSRTGPTKWRLITSVSGSKAFIALTNEPNLWQQQLQVELVRCDDRVYDAFL